MSQKLIESLLKNSIKIHEIIKVVHFYGKIFKLPENLDYV